jgi:short-subunit dehydrogenase
MNIKDKIIIVTGASGGIGLALTKTLANKGAKVVLAARSANTLKKMEKEISNTYAVPTDMRQKEDVKKLIQKTKEKFGRIDILVNNAGQGMRSNVEQINMDDYRSILELNVIAPVETMEEVIPLMRAQGGGLILNVSSMVSKNYFPGLAAYASTKYALNAISLTAREELKKDNIIVSVFHPKMTATDFGKNSRGIPYSSVAGRPDMQADSPEAVAEEIVKLIESEEAEGHM